MKDSRDFIETIVTQALPRVFDNNLTTLKVHYSILGSDKN